MATTIKIENGVMQFVYDDDVAPPLMATGPATVERVSHVEPCPMKPGWLADMRPIGGGVLGLNGEAFMVNGSRGWYLDNDEDLQPFQLREDALRAEREWLARERGL